MPSTVEKLTQRGLIRPPQFVPSNTHYETVMGSVCYGVSTDDSDYDTLGWCIPPKGLIFPHLDGEIFGFGRQVKRFGVYQEHHVFDPDALAGKGRKYDLNIYNIVNYFQLCMDNNPNMVDSLFTPTDCVLHITKVGQMVREARHKFLHKGAWHRFKGYAYSQLHKMSGKEHEPGSKRAQLVEQFGFDVKFAYHTIRLLGECEQILEERDIDLRRNREQLKAIRRGDVPEADVRRMAAEKEQHLERLYENSTLPYSPPENELKALLMACLEEHYGNLSDAVTLPDRAELALRDIRYVLEQYNLAV